MSEFTLALATVAPYYNLALVLIVIWLFVKLFKTPAKARTQLPWKVIFAALCIFIVEELLTVLRTQQLVLIPVHINGFFELGIITLFIYALLKQKEISRV
ncbi:hypothetical protein HY484_01055 [Candidatus Woesearchaeota archaeon]|nr:hypothetical protein [Candidatus Woesearchaeota archaeon]